jgi:hypothetical protein
MNYGQTASNPPPGQDRACETALSECGNPKVLAGLVLTLGKSLCIRWVRRSGIFGGYVRESTPVL